MLTVVVPATQTRLTTVSAVRSALDLNEGDYDNGAVEKMIDRASQSIVEFCGRSFGRETLLETFRGCEAGNGVLLSRSPVVSIVTIDGDGDAVTLPNYEVDPAGVLYRLDNNLRYPWRTRVLAVTYVAGYVLPSDEEGAPASTLPATVEQAVIDEIEAFVSYSERDPLVKSETVDGVGSTTYYVPGNTSNLSAPGSESVLARYKAAAWSVG